MKNISPRDLKEQLDKDQAVIVDVREPAEFRSEHIPHSYLIPLSDLDINKLPMKDKNIVFLCRTGRRSGSACEMFIKHHPDINVYSLTGGLSAWKDAGYEIESSKSKFIPLDRQIQIAAGTLVLLGVLGGFFVSVYFYLLSAFVGCGLIFAGVSGWCGMGKFLAMMPWNK